jgi:transcription elongation factor Elf1
MPISVKQAREILCKSAGDMHETQIRELVDIFTILSDFAIDSYLAKRSKSNEKVYEKNVST